MVSVPLHSFMKTLILFIHSMSC